MIALITMIFLFFGLNFYVSKSIKKSYYLDDSMRKLHLKMIWFLPFVGPLVLRNFWKKKCLITYEINTKAVRDKFPTNTNFESSTIVDY